MIIDKIVIKFKDKSIMKGKTTNFSIYQNYFTLDLLNGEKLIVNVEKMKAAFIVRSFDGNKAHTYTYKDKLPFGGTKVKIEFVDGEVMIGYNPYDVYGQHGFFLHPADMMGNNKCVFAVTTAIKKLSFL